MKNSETEDCSSSKLPSGDDASSLSFVIDRKGDRRNLEYGGPDRYAVPSFYSAGNGSVLGLPRKYRIKSKSDGRRYVEDVEIDTGRRSRKESLLAYPPPENDQKFITSDTPGDWHDVQSDYIPFLDTHGRRLGLESDSSGEGSSEGEETGEPASGQSAALNQLGTFDAFKNDAAHQKHLRLLKATKNSPQNAQLWLDLINHQKTSFGGQGNPEWAGSTSSRGVAELKISLYERALGQVKDQDGREILILGLMHEGKKVWDSHTQLAKWETILESKHSVELWKSYLNFKQTNAPGHSSEECMKVCRLSLQAAQAIEPGRPRDAHCIYIFLRLSLYLWQIDMTEFAIGLWQALLELTFCSPANHSRDQLLSSFQDFWNSEVSRIGEKGANGWRFGRSAEVEQKADRKPQLERDMTLNTWAILETDLSRDSGLPARSLDETSDMDPYRIVLFSDITEYLFLPTTEIGAHLLLNAFLLFSGLDPVSSLPETGKWQTDPFVFSHFPSSKSSRVSPLLMGNEPNSFNPQSIVLESEAIKIGPRASLVSTANFPIGIYPDFIHLTLLQLTSVSPELMPKEALMQYALSIEARTNPRSARKQAKSFLKRQPESLRLYNAYALLDCHMGNIEAAEKVWSTSLSMRASSKDPKDEVTFSVWRDWVWSYMTQKLFQRARSILTMIPDGRVSLPDVRDAESSLVIAAQIKADNFIVLELESCLTDKRVHDLVALTDLLAFYRYLNTDCKLDAALQVYSYYLSTIERVATERKLDVLETIHERRAELLHAHATTFGRPFQPNQLMNCLRESIQKFPNNFLLLWKQHRLGQQAGVLDRLRELDLSVRDQKDFGHEEFSVASICLNVFIELERPSYSGSTNHSIRAAFQRATGQGSNGIYCVNLWKAYILWELSVAEASHAVPVKASRRAKTTANNVKDVFRAALQACPWAKEIYMMPFQENSLNSLLDEEELKQLYHSMIERGCAFALTSAII